MVQSDAAQGWPRVAATTLTEQIYQAVRARVLDGRLAPGEFVREMDLQEAMGASRTPIREALTRLGSEGFLERLPRRGYRVPDESIGDLLHLYPIVASLDLLAGRLALPNLQREDVARLKTINASLGKARHRNDVRRLITLNDQFHYLFAERSGNPRLCEMLNDLRSRLTRLELWYYSDGEHTRKSIEDHDGIIATIEEGNHAEALALLESNMALTYRALAEDARADRDEAAPPQPAIEAPDALFPELVGVGTPWRADEN